MQTRSRNPFITIRTEGAILPPDLLQRVRENDASLGGLRPEEYHLYPGERINEAINRSWNRLLGAWESFRRAREGLGREDAGTTPTRERWLLPLFQELDYGRLQTTRAIEFPHPQPLSQKERGESRLYPISHGWGAGVPASVPIHLVGCGVDLDTRSAGVAGAARTSPHSLVQELLNRSEAHVWAFLSNGLRLRILRDNASLTRPAYVEFDLEAMFDGEVYADFVLLWLLCHQSRVESGDSRLENCWLEKWSKAAQEQGTRALEQLRRGVEEAIAALGQGFLQHAANKGLRERLRAGTLSTQEYYRQLLRLVYRLIFLFVAEDRDLLFDPAASDPARSRYTRYYSTARLRDLAEKRRGTRHHDLFVGLRLVMSLLGGEGIQHGDTEITENKQKENSVYSVTPWLGLGLPVLGSFLFSREAVAEVIDGELPNQALLEAVRALAFTVDGHILRPVDYKNLGPEELGSVYESLLELHPELNVDAGTFALATASGHERKTTGSYYTPSSLIQVLLDSALDPVIEERLKAAGSSTHNQQSAILNLKVCDPACGSGHFLIAAAHRLAKRLAALRTGTDEPAPEATRTALREVIARCLYGVDINPMSVELCKVSLWMEALEPGKPLSFLDAHIQCGNSLVGVGPGLDIEEIPDDAFQPAFGDDKATATALRKRNKREREGQMGFRWDVTVLRDAEDLAAWVAKQAANLDAMPEEAAEQIHAKEAAYQFLISNTQYLNQKLELDFWTAAFFWPIPTTDAERMLAPTQQELRALRAGKPPDAELARRVHDLAEKNRFFHWAFAFPTVFSSEKGGFDVVLGNPPWERIKLQEQEFFAGLDPKVANAPNKAARQKLINALSLSNPELATAFNNAKHDADSQGNFVRKSTKFILTGMGDVNTYSIFSELFRSLLFEYGRAGIIVPIGIATDDTTKNFFSSLMENQELAQLIGFENESFIFPNVHHAFKFCALTIVGTKLKMKASNFAFLCRNFEHVKQTERQFKLSYNDLKIINPNTRTCPVFRTHIDTEIVKKIYQQLPIVNNEQTDENPWGIYYIRLIHLSDHVNFLRDYDQLLSQNGKLVGNKFFLPDETTFLPVYEARQIFFYDHRYATYANVSRENVFAGKANDLRIDELMNPNISIIPRYWVPEELFVDLMKKYAHKRHWLLSYRDITSNVVERTCIPSIIPFTPATVSLPTIGVQSWEKAQCLVGNLSSLIFDYVTRTKVGGTHLSFGIFKQLPVLPPTVFNSIKIEFITPRIVELTFTAWDLQPFAQDMGYDGPPFRWDEDRRAFLRAELDAYYAHLYGLTRDELRYILDPQDVYGEDFPGETFRVLKEKEIKQYGEYRTRRLVLEAWDRLAAVDFNPEAYAPMTDPPPADPRVAHPNRDGSPYTGPGLVIEARAAQAPSSTPSSLRAQPPAEAIRDIPVSRSESRPQPTSSPPKPTPPPASPLVEESPTPPTDWGMYKCELCGQIAMGFAREDHAKKMHVGKEVRWGKVG